MLEWLKTILGDAYTAEIDSKVSAEIGKAFVARADFNAKNDAVKALEGQITERDKQIKGFEKLAGDNEALTTQLTAAQEANKTAKTEYEGNLKKLTISSRIETALMGAKAKNVKAVRALLDESKISLDGENTIGLNDQIEAIQKSDPDFFGVKDPGNPPPPGGGNPPPTPNLDTTDMAAYKAAREKM